MILSDNEIALLCEGERPMIAPFEPKQVSLNEQGARLLSYGVSSYGYDAQLAEQFQIFSNQDATLIDPKRLDTNSLKDAKIHVDAETGEKYVILPPHSYGLSYTKQYLRIPNDVLVICLGKSTYARCFTGDTRIALADGTNPTFLEAINRVKAGEKLFGYSVDNELNIVITELVAPRKIGNEKIFEVELDSGDIIRCTEDHKFITRDGLEIEAKDLHEGDSLFPFYRRETPKGYLQIAQPESWTFDFAHKLADEWNIRHGVYQKDQTKAERHHLDHNKLNNTPSNIQPMTHREHTAYHNGLKSASSEYRKKLSIAQKNSWEKNSKNEEWLSARLSHLRDMTNSWQFDPALDESRRRHAESIKKYLKTAKGLREIEIRRQALRALHRTKKFQEIQQERLKKLWENGEFKQAMAELARNLKIRKDITEETVRSALESEGSIRGAAKKLECDRTTFRRFAGTIAEFKDKWEASKVTAEQFYEAMCKYGSQTKAALALGISRSHAKRHFAEATAKFYGAAVNENHKVIAVRETDTFEDVYCLTASEFGNFALDAGVFVLNCGIHTNVTPLEPGWCGNVVIEISNSTSLPVKIYLDEGIAQFVFLRGKACRTSYADRNGKYQGQEGITLARV